MKRTASELRENDILTGEEQARNDNLTVDEVSINCDFDDLDFSFDDFEIDLDIDLDFLGEQKPNNRTNRERTKRNSKIKPEHSPRTKPRGSQEKV